MSSKIINIGVNQGVLWVGGEAYPLHNIARVQNVELVPRRGRAVGSFVKQVLLWAVLGAGGIAGLRFADLPSSDVETYTEYVAVAVGALVLVSTIGLLVALARRTYHALVIETSGTPHTAVISPDETVINGLVHQIMRAIGNPRDPRTNFTTTVVHHHHGNNYFGGQHATVNGSDNVGIRN
ncbi:DUF6232 family protein [Actinophytocola oryzae]|uniref:Uncharacterized protein n=1 Tax=Actinophytocola oryzae TaxID=502181 RepID=A0A4R7W047_9PSEU|nr:DUF6232 family protein [Actinophytocola oryzae]TDV55308.1 hypothetical protein CLV71_103549 [Actinophytocola oryzae]